MSFLDRFLRLSQSRTALSAEFDNQPGLVAALQQTEIEEAGRAGARQAPRQVDGNGKSWFMFTHFTMQHKKEIILSDKCFKCSGDVGCFSAKR